MKKKVIALAVAGLASSAVFAQMNVTIYGNIDLSLMHATGTSSGNQGNAASTLSGTGVDVSGTTATARGSQTTMNTGNRSSSRVGFMGVEDLGGGLKADFKVESDVVADGATGQAAPAASGTSGAGLIGNRVATIGVTGGLGSLTMGRQKTYALDNFGAYDATEDSGSGSIGAMLLSPANSTNNNSIKYTSPNMSGFTAVYQFNMSEAQDKVSTMSTTGGQTGSGSGLSLVYAGGPLSAHLQQYIWRDAYAGVVSATAAQAALGRQFTLNHLGVAYDFGVAKIGAQYVTTITTQSSQDTARAIDSNTWNLSARIPMGAHMFRVNYVTTNDKRVNNQDGSSWNLGYDYALSKRTTAYAGITAVSNKNGATYCANSTSCQRSMTGLIRGSNLGRAVTASETDGRTNAFYAGMNHKF